jgi:hypothetical protein
MELAKTTSFVLGKYNSINEFPNEISKIKWSKSIKELAAISHTGTKQAILAIVAANLSLNVKGRGIVNENQFEALTEHIMSNCSTLQIEEVNYIFKKGVLGLFGQIYNDISLDVICGIDGWIETYYKKHRPKRSEGDYKEPLCKEPANGNEKLYTHAQYLKRNPEERKKYRLKELTAKAKLLKCGYPELKLMLKYTGRGEDVFEALKNNIDASYEVRDIKSVSKIHFVANEIKKLLK